ncbi:hypothetical protein COCSADRAFT_264020 [Bipolaris sorokiniana ND90Pr]|uniref:Rhodopsin domain-containing protein n=1 Tax=Cochliobolus sativus (strain ND90Pr / ATCC 201652) TaxID=665912 RepID=M2SP99_COCSN|nr:uncharacterized protein COCSADRAFT_264020 [Bipolaris sorokiniana ND90Pr]EMD58572.1 hypothetical protein COCSADRAFT_264020 [Bipolaris sorokiniana ND90Pr]
MDEPAPGEVSHLMVHTYRLIIAFLILSWIFISLRVYTRTVIISNFGWDDTAMVSVGAIFTVYCGTIIYIFHHGGGTVIADFDQLNRLMKIATVSESSYVLTMMLIKISLAIFFARIVVKRWHLTVICVFVTLSIISSICTYLYIFLRCGPDLDQYLIRELIRDCTPIQLDIFMAYQQAVFNSVTDIAFLFMPALVLWNSPMERRAKISVGIILVVATLGAVCSLIRFKYIKGVLKNGDYFYQAVHICMWSTIEVGTCIIAGCTATLRPLMKVALVQVQVTLPLSRLGSGAPPTSSTLKSSQQSNHRSSRMIRISDNDLEYGNADPTGSTLLLPKTPEFVELIVRPDPVILAPAADNTQPRTGSMFG